MGVTAVYRSLERGRVDFSRCIITPKVDLDIMRYFHTYAQ